MDILINSLMESTEIPFLISFSKFLNAVFNPEVLIVVGIILAFCFLRKNPRNPAVVAGSFVVVGILVKMLKEIFIRVRPQNALIEASGYSLPSGHVAVSVVFFGFLVYFLSLKKSMKFKTASYFLFFIFIFLMGLSRIYLRVHWFTDILAGFLIGGIVLVAGIILLRKFSN